MMLSWAIGRLAKRASLHVGTTGSVAMAAGVAVVFALATAPASLPSAAGTLNLQVSLRFTSPPAPCPPGAPADAGGCRARSGKGSFPGLGAATQTYAWYYRLGPPTCPSPDDGKPQPNTGRLVIAGKGEIQFALAEGKRCTDLEGVRYEPQDFTITGGTGPYEGASGSGTLAHAATSGVGTDTWTGTLVVAGHEFDVVPPVFTGANPKTVRAPKGTKSVRVVYTITATDAVEGQVAAPCVPRSGSRFPIGRSVVKCSATDTSANAAITSFRVTVKPR
jgi:hypothetical protein